MSPKDFCNPLEIMLEPKEECGRSICVKTLKAFSTR